MCPSCGLIFTTEEHAVPWNIVLLKRNGKKQHFVYEKLFVSIFLSLDKGKERDNGDQAILAKEITEKIIKELIRSQKVVPTSYVVICVYKALYKVNRHTANVYRFYSPKRDEILRKALLG